MPIQAIVGLTEPKIQATVISSVIAAGEKGSILIHTKGSSGLKYFLPMAVFKPRHFL